MTLLAGIVGAIFYDVYMTSQTLGWMGRQPFIERMADRIEWLAIGFIAGSIVGATGALCWLLYRAAKIK